MTPEQMQKIVDGAPDQTASYYMYDTYFKSQNPTEWFYWEENQWKFTNYSKRFENFLISLKDLRTELAKHDTLDLEPSDIPHGTIVLEK